MISKQPFGRTGHDSTRIIFGGYALSNATQGEADRALELLLEYGVNHIDTAPMYGDAEKRIGPWMKSHRDDFFLATKTRKRSYEGAWKDLQQSFCALCCLWTIAFNIAIWQANPGLGCIQKHQGIRHKTS